MARPVTRRRAKRPIRPPAIESGAARPWRQRAAITAIVAAVAVACWALGQTLAARVQRGRLPPPVALDGFSEAARSQIGSAEAAARQDPGSAVAVGALGHVYAANLLRAPADRAYAAAERLPPRDWRWTYYRAMLFEQQGEHAAAREAFERVIAVVAGHGLSWFHLGEIAFKQGRIADAEQAYRRARDAAALAPFAVPGGPTRQVVPLSAYAQLGLARVALEQGASDTAVKLLQGIVSTHPRFGPARTLFHQRRDRSTPGASPTPAPAARAYTPPSDPLIDAVIAQSHNTDLLLRQAEIAARGGDTPWREFLTRRALATNPRGLDVLLAMADMLQQAGDHNAALEYLRQAEAIAPDDHHTLVQQGRSLTELDRLSEAERVLQRAARVRDAAAEYNLGIVLDRQKRWDEARARYERALAINPFHTRSMNNLGIGLARRGQASAALAMYGRALESAPDDPEVLSNFASVLIGERRLDEAMRALQTAIAIDPDAPDAYNNLGIALAQSGRWTEAKAHFEQALKRAPNHTDARRNLEQLMVAERRQPPGD
jgi:tetratricopeptide (TPR) repeat protein